MSADIMRRGGVVLPMHASEAMWLNFRIGRREGQYPFALKVAAGKINALTGKPWSAELSADPQDYIVVPAQPWLDGFCIDKGIVRQFIAERLGDGFSVEEQLTGKAEFGGLQILAYPMKRESYFELVRAPALARRREALERLLDNLERRLAAAVHTMHETTDEIARVKDQLCADEPSSLADVERQIGGLAMRLQRDDDARFPPSAPVLYCRIEGGTPAHRKLQGLGAGGRMKQHIHADPYGLDAWDQAAGSRCFVALLDAADWSAVTGCATPTKPLSAREYQKAGIPWFDHYDPAAPSVEGAGALSKLKSWAQMKLSKGQVAFDNETIAEIQPIDLGPVARSSTNVREIDV